MFNLYTIINVFLTKLNRDRKFSRNPTGGSHTKWLMKLNRTLHVFSQRRFCEPPSTCQKTNKWQKTSRKRLKILPEDCRILKIRKVPYFLLVNNKKVNKGERERKTMRVKRGRLSAAAAAGKGCCFTRTEGSLQSSHLLLFVCLDGAPWRVAISQGHQKGCRCVPGDFHIKAWPSSLYPFPLTDTDTHTRLSFFYVNSIPIILSLDWQITIVILHVVIFSNFELKQNVYIFECKKESFRECVMTFPCQHTHCWCRLPLFFSIAPLLQTLTSKRQNIYEFVEKSKANVYQEFSLTILIHRCGRVESYLNIWSRLIEKLPRPRTIPTQSIRLVTLNNWSQSLPIVSMLHNALYPIVVGYPSNPWCNTTYTASVDILILWPTTIKPVYPKSRSINAI